MKTLYTLAAAALGAVALPSCYGPTVAGAGPTPMRTSGAYSAQFQGAGSTYHSWDRRDPYHDWRHDDERYDGDLDDDDDDGVAYRSTRYVAPGPHYTSYRTTTMVPGAMVSLPIGARRVMYGGQVYYNSGVNWYQPYGTGYVIVHSPY
jgi:hypothetical protein